MESVKESTVEEIRLKSKKRLKMRGNNVFFRERTLGVKQDKTLVYIIGVWDHY